MINLLILVIMIELLKSAENSTNTVFCPPIKRIIFALCSGKGTGHVPSVSVLFIE